MAATDIVSFKVRDQFNSSRSVPIAIASGATLANIGLWANTIATAMNAVMDGFIEGITVTVTVAMTGTPKAAADGSNRVGTGARLTYDVASSDYSDSVFIPSWKDAGFNGEVVVKEGAYDTFIDLLATVTNTLTATDKDALAFLEYLRGVYTQRK